VSPFTPSAPNPWAKSRTTMSFAQGTGRRRAMAMAAPATRRTTSTPSRSASPRHGKVMGDVSVDSLIGVGGGSRSWTRNSAGTLVDRVRRDSLLRNSLFIMSTTVVNSAFGFVFWLLAARLFAAHIVGLTAAITAASTIVVLVASLGVGGTLIQSLPEQGKSVGWALTFWAGMATAIFTSLAIGTAALILLPLISEQVAALHSVTYAVVFSVATVAMTAGAILDYVFIAERTAGKMLGRNAAVAAGKVVLIVILTVAAGKDALNLLGAWAAASVLGLGLGIGLLTRHRGLLQPLRPSALFHKALGLRSRLAGNQLIGIGGALLPYLLPLLVTARLSSTDNAYFYTTWMMAGIFLIIAPAVAQSLFAEGVHDPEDLRTKARSALAIVGAILVPGVVGVFVLGGTLLSAFGSAYAEHGIGLLRIVLLAAIPDAIVNVYVAVMRVRGRLAAAAGLSVVMGIGIVGLSWVLLPVVGISAVGWAFLIVQLCGCAFVVFDRFHQPALPHAQGQRLEETV
jgi:O-antigen/teichoic acid export membrane protein